MASCAATLTTGATSGSGVGPSPRTYGRVPNEKFADHVAKEWWKGVFDAMYLKTDGDVVDDPDVTRREIQLLDSFAPLHAIFSRPGARVLDLCCGQGRHTLALATTFPGLQLHGHDQSEYLIGVARERAHAMQQNGVLVQSAPTFTLGDCRAVPAADGTFDLVMVLGSSLGYFDNENDDKNVFHEIRRVLAPGGVLLLDYGNCENAEGAIDVEGMTQRSWEWIDDHVFVCRERAVTSDGKKLISRELITNVHTGVVRDQFFTSALYTNADVLKMVADAGLVGGEVLGQSLDVAATDLSKRQQDMGMMDDRVLVMAHHPDHVHVHPAA